MIRRQVSFFLSLAVIIASGLQFVTSSDDFKDDELLRFLVKNRLYTEKLSNFLHFRCPGRIVSHPDSGKDICICERGKGFNLNGELSCEDCGCGEGALTCSGGFGRPKICYCRNGYELKEGKCVKAICYAFSCANGGTCFRNGNDDTVYKCRCAPGYTGEHCDTDINPCDTVYKAKCYNGGTCWLASNTEYWCECLSNFTGVHCETFVNGCASYNPCFYGSTCYQDAISKTILCICPETRTGGTCETEIDPCAANPCKNGNCYRRSGLDFLCFCYEGFHGNDCSEIDLVPQPGF